MAESDWQESEETKRLKDLLGINPNEPIELFWRLKRPGDDWQSIETAPKDGTRILVWETNVVDPFVTIAEWRRDEWIVSDSDFGHRTEFDRWQPLPTPPQTEGGE